jgi:CheY-like chemotaxis protein
MKCLLVDDEPGIREGLAALLRRRGHEIRTAADCAAAAAAIRDDSFDVVITDWRLPDGLAVTFVVDCPYPVVAVSGHPEEVQAHAIVRAVLAKPVSPSRLLETVDALRSAAPLAAAAALPCDVQHILDAAAAAVPAGTSARVDDDGTFVVWRAELADDAPLGALGELGGDLQVHRSAGGSHVALRLCRDGRPDPGMVAVRPDWPWPEAAELALDFHGTELGEERFTACLERVRSRAANGQRVHLLNIPEPLRRAASDWERANDMPMKAPVGPRLPADLVDLWSQP